MMKPHSFDLRNHKYEKENERKKRSAVFVICKGWHKFSVAFTSSEATKRAARVDYISKSTCFQSFFFLLISSLCCNIDAVYGLSIILLTSCVNFKDIHHLSGYFKFQRSLPPINTYIKPHNNSQALKFCVCVWICVWEPNVNFASNPK